MKVIVSYSFIKHIKHLIDFMEENMLDEIIENTSLEVDIAEIRKELEE